jgi:hypothetical protein
MSTNPEIAGNYVTSGGEGDPEYVAEKLGEMREERAEQERQALEQTEAQAEVFYGDDPEGIELSVAGETILADPIGLGRRARLMKQATQADERGDEMAQVETAIQMIDTLVDATPDEYDTDWWDDRSESQIRDAFQTLAAESAGGNE